MREVHCPHCHAEYSVDAASLGQVVTCPRCHQSDTVAVFLPERQPRRRRPDRNAWNSTALVAFVVGVGLLVAGAAGVYLYERASLKADRIRLRQARIELGSAMIDRESRERELDAKGPPRNMREMDFERRDRYGQDAKWREIDRKVMNLDYEIVVILDRWPELR
jgi:predicted Zn finger-like uncharacterized protein